MASVTRVCKQCRKQFKAYPGTETIFCGKRCTSAYEWKKKQKRSEEAVKEKSLSVEVGTATKGAIGELLVCADLLTKGYHVFRSVSPTCPNDLVAIKGDLVWRLEVKTIRGFSREQSIKRYHKSNVFDVIALVFDKGGISYFQADGLQLYL